MWPLITRKWRLMFIPVIPVILKKAVCIAAPMETEEKNFVQGLESRFLHRVANKFMKLIKAALTLKGKYL